MNLKAYRGISAAVSADLASTLAKYGLKMGKMSARVDEFCGTVRYTIEAADVNLKDASGEKTTPEAERYKQFGALLHGLEPEWLGRKLKMGGRTYTVDGMREGRSEKCVTITRDDGKTFVVKPEALHRQFAGS